MAVSCRVLKLSRCRYRWLARPVIIAELTWAYRANDLFDAHREDPEFGYRFLVGEAALVEESMCEQTAWRICETTVGGQCSVRSEAATAGDRAHQFKTI